MIFNGRDLPCRRSFATDCGRDHWAVWRKLLLRCNPKVSPCDLNVSPCNPKVSICNPRSKHLSFPVNLGLCPDGEPVGASLGLGRASERSLAWESCVLLGNPASCLGILSCMRRTPVYLLITVYRWVQPCIQRARHPAGWQGIQRGDDQIQGGAGRNVPLGHRGAGCPHAAVTIPLHPG
jgi:hypothetical protein